GLIDIFPPGGAEPVRLDFFGDSLEGVRRFDPLSQRSTSVETELLLVPVSEVPLDAAAIERFRVAYRRLFGAITDSDPLYAAISEGRKYIGMEHWLPLFHTSLETLFDYAPGAALTMDHLAEQARDERLAAIADYYEARRAARGGGLGEAGSTYKPLPPDLMYLSATDWDGVARARPLAVFSPFKLPDGQPDAIDGGGVRGRDFAPERTQPGSNVYDAVRAHVHDLKKAGKRVVIASFTAGASDRLGSLLRDHGIDPLEHVENFAAAGDLKAAFVALAVLPLEHGFETADLAVIGEQDILGDRLVRPRRKTRRAENFIADVSQITPGDLVVHVDHGIGRYEGLQTLDIGGAPHDCLSVTYDGNDRLYVPVENIDVLSRYGSEQAGVALDRLGGAGWQARKARLKQRLKDMAADLIRIAAQRELREADRLTPPEGLYAEFCARFPYEATDDQARAIEDTLEDLATGRPMDRLVCGDVGFGKTEVALRAAFVAAMGGRQVVLICPTTLLARQHYRNFSERFKGFPVRIAQLSRLVASKQASETREALRRGDVDLVIGTHALLGKGVMFKDLGLVIVDEEQHFGVKHKERLKQLKADVHVLTLTATPIPRTLQLALSGVRELSLIASAPVDRLAIRTYVTPFDPLIVREAILRERYRGGQVFYVCPRIEDLSGSADFLKNHVPEVKFAVAHGQMAASDLEQVMTAFYEGQYDVLLSTNIVESGLDIPTANTIVVHRADMFGLAQLYQLRGRVGRSKLRAYAYLTLPANGQLSVGAEKRLRVLQALDNLGAGFSLASHDLDQRGAGNLLGEEQSGHIREVGFELYQEMLEEAVAEARGQGAAESEGGAWSPQINIGTAVLIPESYVADLNLRLELYRRIARLEGREETDAFAAEMIDRFGPLPVEVEHLLKIISIKHLCRLAGIEKVEAGPKGATIAFRNNQFANPAGLVAFLSKQGAAKLRTDHKLVLLRDWQEARYRLTGVLAVAEQLAEIARIGQTAAA
ncbi:MAG: transcription-repair coupling factor, partial [Alphaproteobacteria bacterium]|nr:transcription-repair coupling factor [Alphaproteobacteria bacterium]